MTTDRSDVPAPYTADADHIQRTATRLFAGLGYDGTTTEMIADAAGVSREAVLEAGGRHGLYRRTLEHHTRVQCAMLDELGAGFTDGDDRMAIVLQRLIDFYLDHLDLVAIWRQRRMMDAADMHDLEERYQYPVQHKVMEILGPDIVQDPRYQLFSVVFAWCLLGFTTGGAPRSDGTLMTPEDPGDQDLFRARMVELLETIRHA